MFEDEHVKTSLEDFFSDGRDVGEAVVGRTDDEVDSILN
jgi:hypothetical protein